MNGRNDFGEFDPELWIELLVDGQLDLDQRRQVFDFCNSNQEYWKKLAVSFCDNQVLAASLGDGENHSARIGGSVDSDQTGRFEWNPSEHEISHSVSEQKSGNQVNKPERNGWAPYWLTLAASIVFFLCGLLASGWWGDPNHNNGFAGSEESAPLGVTLVDNRLRDPVLDLLERKNLQMENEITKRQLRSLKEYLKKTPTLVQVRNDETTAVYQSEHRLPDFLIRALVFAGHRIQISQTIVDVSLPDGTKIGHPVHSYEIQKYALANEVAISEEG